MRLRRVVVILLVVLLSTPMISCGTAIKISELHMCVGEYVDLSSYSSGNIVASTDDNAVSVIGGTVLKAEEPGEANVTVSKGLKTKNVSVKVEYAPVDLTVTCGDSLYTTVRNSILSFYADLGEFADPQTPITWTVNGTRSGTGNEFELVVDYGKYVVTASAGGKQSSLTAVCYEGFSYDPYIDSSDILAKVGESVELKISCFEDAEVIWFVGDKEEHRGREFAFTPALPGDYTVYALVNGFMTNEVKVTAFGAPGNVTVDFDSEYPAVKLKWVGPSAEYKVTVGGIEYGMDSGRFSGNTFDLGGLIDLKNPTPVAVFLGEEGTEITSPKLSSKELEYLEKSNPVCNYYASSESEIYELVEYAMTYRPPIGQKISLSVYIGYECDQTPGLLLAKAWKRTEQAGRYKLKATGSTKKGDVANFEIECYTGNEPTDFDTHAKQRYPSLTTPSFAGGMSEFAVDSKPKLDVSSSEQLYYAVQNGYCPVPKTQAVASLYSTVRSVMGNIMSDEMTEEQKVRAVYDWVMWNTHYDYESASLSDVTTSVVMPAYYLEGVFTTGFAVCDGISKAICLMCNMAGIPCVRVVGTVTQTTVERHAWNKVMLGGRWYILDATWDDSRITFGGKAYEGALHNYYLVSDGMAPTHRSAYEEPAAPFSFGYYETLGLSISDASSTQLVECLRAAENYVGYEVRIGNETVEQDHCCIEIELSAKAENFLKLNQTLVTEIICTALPATVSIRIDNGLLLVYLENK